MINRINGRMRFQTNWLTPAFRPPWRAYPSNAIRYSTHRRDDHLDDTELATARRWLARFDAETIPREIGQVTFSRSSGPGGQNVNKVSTKATLRVPLTSLLTHIPSLLHATLRESRYMAPRTEELVIQADDSRKQADNVTACYRKLHELVAEAGRQTVPGETSSQQTARVKQLQKAEAAGRRRMKEFRSQKKTARKGASGE